MARCNSSSLVALGLAVLGTATPALAATPPSSAAYREECGSCHVAYTPRLLTTTEWARVLGDLEHHYGVDASLESSTLQVVGRTLGVVQPTAANPKLPLPRITTKPWFREEHDDVGAATFRAASVRSAANCAACHVGAERGDYEEDRVRIPR